MYEKQTNFGCRCKGRRSRVFQNLDAQQISNLPITVMGPILWVDTTVIVDANSKQISNPPITVVVPVSREL